MSPLFEVLDMCETPLGQLCLRRRELLSRPGVVVTEVTLNHVFLMSSYHTESERLLARAAMDLSPGEDLSVLVGGLGLGFTTAEALGFDRVAQVETVELLEPVLAWLDRGWLPTGQVLGTDPRSKVTRGDIYARLLAPPERSWDVILVDVDHAPEQQLDTNHREFYTESGMRSVAEHLHPGGVLAIWSTESSPEAEAVMDRVFSDTKVEQLTWWNDLVDEEKTDTILLGRTAAAS